jgi:uncharacterized protein (TIGR03437 family)
MINIKYLVLLAATTASAQVRLQYLNLGPQPAPCCVVTDANGNTYVASSYVTSITNEVHTKIVVFKVNPNNGTVYQLMFGGSVNDNPTAIAVDSQGDLFVAGTTFSPDFPLVNPLISNGPLTQSNGVDSRGFLSKIDPSGSLVFSTFIGGLQSDMQSEVDAITLVAAGEVYLTGETKATDFPVTAGAFSKTGNAFVTKVSNAGDKILLSTFIGPGGTGFAIGVDNQGAITVAGSAWNNDFPVTAGAFQSACGCGSGPNGLEPIYAHIASFVSRLSADGSQLLWSTFLGGSGNGLGLSQDTVQALALTSDGGVVVAGIAESPDFPVTLGAFQTTLLAQGGGLGPPSNLFTTRFNATGTALEFSTLLGGSVLEQFHGLQLDGEEHPWVTGTTYSPDFPVLPSGLAIGDEFVVELASDGSRLLDTQMFPSGSAGAVLALSASGDETLLGGSGSLIQIPAGGLSGISILAQVNAAAYAPSARVSPGDIISLYGTGLGPVAGVGAQLDSSGKIATKLAGMQVTCDGIPAPLLYVGANQINAVVPFGVSGKPSISVQVTSPTASTPSLELTVVPAYPEIFSVVLNEDGSVNSSSNPAAPDSTVTFWVNGAGLFTPALPDGAITASPPLPAPVLPVSALFGGQPIAIAYSATPGQVAGLLQVSARLPQSVPVAASGLQVQVGAFVSDGLGIAVQ